MPTYSSYDEWRDDLLSEQIGRIWLAKLDFDLKHGNLLPATVVKFRSIMESNLHNIAPLLSPLSVIDFVIRQAPLSFDLQGLRLPNPPTAYSCIVGLEVFARFLVNQRVLSTIIDDGDDELDFIWDHLGTLITSRFYSNELKTDRDFFWCTPTDRLISLKTRYSPNKAATVIRTRLGLHHVSKSTRLICIDIPLAILAGKRLRAPTAFDGGSNPVFIPSKNSDGYGRTLNLKKLARDLKEVVMETVPFTPDFTAIKVGKVGAGVPPLNLSDIESLI
jgi:hypothetical protein